MDTGPTLADRLRAWRADLGLSQRQAAARLGVSLRTLQGWEAGRLPQYPSLLAGAMGAADSVPLDPADAAMLRAWAEREGCTVADLVRRVISAALDRVTAEIGAAG